MNVIYHNTFERFFFHRMVISLQTRKKSDPFVRRFSTSGYLAWTRIKSTIPSSNSTLKLNATKWRKSSQTLRIDFSSIMSERNLETWSSRPKMFPLRSVRSIRWGFSLADFRPAWPSRSWLCFSRNAPKLTSKQKDLRSDSFSSGMPVTQSAVSYSPSPHICHGQRLKLNLMISPRHNIVCIFKYLNESLS